MKGEKDEFLTDGGKSAMMTMRRRPLADRSRLELGHTVCTGIPMSIHTNRPLAVDFHLVYSKNVWTLKRSLTCMSYIAVCMCYTVVQIYAEEADKIRSLSFPRGNSSSMTADWLDPLEDNIYLSGEALQTGNKRKLFIILLLLLLLIMTLE